MEQLKINNVAEITPQLELVQIMKLAIKYKKEGKV
jgi:hypothetical protein